MILNLFINYLMIGILFAFIVDMATEYARSKLNAIPGDVAARVIIVPKIGPTHGVQPAAKAIPNKNDTGNLAPALFGKIFFSILSIRIL